jgi:hypothetical protein
MMPKDGTEGKGPVNETWIAEAGCVWQVQKGQQSRIMIRSSGCLHRCEEDAKLAACAPEMARLLRAAEWSGSLLNSYGEESALACPWCWGAKELTSAVQDRAGVTVGHTHGCKLVAVLRKAGIR